MMDTDEKLYALMAIAEEQQAAVSSGIDGLTFERQKLAEQRTLLMKHVGEISLASKEASGTIETAVREALRKALDETVQVTAGEVAGAFSQSTEPVIKKLSGIVGAATAIEDKLYAALSWFSGRALVIAATVTMAVVLAIWLIGMAAVSWQRYKIEALMNEREDLTAEVSKLQAHAALLDRRVSSCGKQKLPCVRVDIKDKYGQDGDYYLLKSN